jgi:deoxyribodipyrimidine photolyase
MLYPLLGLNFIGLIYFFSVFRKVRQNRIEIDSQEIRISNKKEVIQIIPKADIKEITFAESYNISRQNRDIMLRILLNKKNVDYIEIGHSNGKQRFDLEFDSSYMLTQFNKWRESWNEKLA